MEHHPVVCRDEETRVEIPRALATAVVAVPTRHELTGPFFVEAPEMQHV